MKAPARRILPAGATGDAGQAVARALGRRGHEVIALARSPSAVPPGCDVGVADAGYGMSGHEIGNHRMFRD